MPIFPVSVKTTGLAPDIARKEFRSITKEAWEAVGIFWHQQIRPMHFEPPATSTWKYRPRTPRYQARKQRTFGHNKPLVWSAETRELTRIQDVRATSKGVRVVLNARKLNFQPAGHDLVGELTRVDMERFPDKAVLNVFDRAVQAGIDRVRATRVTRIAS